MKTTITLLFLFIFSSFITAQKMVDGPYTVKLSKQDTREWDHKTDYQTIRFKQTSGEYILYKESEKIAAGSFTLQTVNDKDPELNFNTGSLTIGNNLVYDRAKKRFNYMDTMYIPKRVDTAENIILSGILIVAKVKKFNVED